ncbi:PEGA domain-containing protein [Spongiimicrobium sp. 2-473A-2-J]|uniref:PEGA domain-containing protein n=1 Tax=Eudoraea algarum TaxID=3417568 RepID=UPI003D365FC2
MKQMKNIFKVLITFPMLLFMGCATIISGSRQTIKVASIPSSATVYINEVEVGKTPVERSLKRNQEYQVLIKLDGYQPYETLISKEFNAWYLGNILIGGIIGLIIDPITGAMYKLTPEELTANLTHGGTAFRTEKKDVYLMVNMDIDPGWEKVGQLIKMK